MQVAAFCGSISGLVAGFLSLAGRALAGFRGVLFAPATKSENFVARDASHARSAHAEAGLGGTRDFFAGAR